MQKKTAFWRAKVSPLYNFVRGSVDSSNNITRAHQFFCLYWSIYSFIIGLLLSRIVLFLIHYTHTYYWSIFAQYFIHFLHFELLFILPLLEFSVYFDLFTYFWSKQFSLPSLNLQWINFDSFTSFWLSLNLAFLIFQNWSKTLTQIECHRKSSKRSFSALEPCFE